MKLNTHRVHEYHRSKKGAVTAEQHEVKSSQSHESVDICVDFSYRGVA